MKLLDRYIIRQFLLSTSVSLVGFILIYVAIDMMEKLDKFLDKNVPALIVFEYYVNFTPQIIALILPIALLLGTLFAAGKMSTNNEIIAMRSAGMSLYRFMAPFVLVGFLLSGFAVYFNGWILPRANARVLEILREHVHENLISNSEFNLHLQESPTTIVVMQDFSLSQAKANRVSVQYFDKANTTHVLKRIDAQSMSWDSVRHAWKLIDATERRFVSDTLPEILRKLIGEEAFIKFTFTPTELREKQLQFDEMTNTELARRIDLAKRAGQDTAHDQVDYYSKYAMAFTSFIVILFGVPFASKKKRGGLSLEFSVAIFISFIFLTFTKISQTFGYSGLVSPVLTAWLANALFLTLAIIVIARAQK
ncbi:MAG: LptF/LptG family permease [Candidatus Kapaibacterium sp.]